MDSLNSPAIKKSHPYLYLLIVTGVVLLFIRLGSISLYQVAEARNAECAREMLDKEDWIKPVFNGELRTDKPILEYWAMMAAYKIGGVSEGSARFFSAACGLLLLVFTFLISSKYLGKKAGWWTALILSSSIHFIMQFRLATPDPYLILFSTLALFSFFEGWSCYKKGASSRKWFLLLYLLLGLSVLAKGPIGLLLPGLILLIFLILKHSFNWQTIRALFPWWGLLIVLLVAAPWFVLVHLQTDGAWTRDFFLRHNIGRFDKGIGNHHGIFLLTFLFVFLGMLPFSVFIVQAVIQTWKKFRQNDLLLLSLLAFICVTAFYAVSKTKLINYTVPAYPFIAIMLGAYWSDLSSGNRLRAKMVSFPLLILISLALPVGMFFWLRSSPELKGLEWLALFLILPPIATVFSLKAFQRKKISKSFYWIAGSYMVTTLLIFSYPYPLLDRYTPVIRAEKLVKNHPNLVAWGRFDDAFVYYSRRSIPLIREPADLEDYLSHHQNTLLISNDRDQKIPEGRKDLKLLHRYPDVFESRVTSIYQQIKP